MSTGPGAGCFVGLFYASRPI